MTWGLDGAFLGKEDVSPYEVQTPPRNVRQLNNKLKVELMSKQYWLMKSEPDVFSIDDLEKHRATLWEGVRNYQARNFMMKDMRLGDEVLFYHSNADPAAAVGVAQISGLAVPDPTQFDKKSEYYDAKATKDKPIWFCVEVGYMKTFAQPVSLAALRAEKSLAKMLVLQKGQRLSVQPVTAKEFARVCELGSK